MLKTWRQTRHILPFDAVLLTPEEEAAAAAAAGGGGAKPFKVFASESDYQAEINAAEARARALAERRGLSPEEKLELDRLRNEARDRERKEAEAKGNYEAALNSAKSEFVAKETSWQKRQQELLEELQSDRCTGKIIAASSSKAVNPGQLAKLLVAENRIKLDDHNKPVVLDEEGKPLFIAGHPATVEELVDTYLKTNKHLAVPGAHGTGAAGGQAAGDGDAATSTGGDADGEIKKLEDEYKLLFEAARKSNSPTEMAKAHNIKVKLDRLKVDAKAKR